ncbi:MAG: DUF6259 domain-containing protein [Planctomycetaceae bacterium]|nr:DUF6259 domain-containing protein [Planctomycetaceae bacterium]
MLKTYSFVLFSFLSVLSFAAEPQIQLEISSIPANGLVVKTLDLLPIQRLYGLNPQTAFTMQHNGKEIPCQFATADSGIILVAQFPDDLVALSQTETLRCNLIASNNSKPVKKILAILTETPSYQICQNNNIFAGMPYKIVFNGTGKVLETHRWQDRLHHPEYPGFDIRSGTAEMELIDDGEVCRIVRNTVQLQGSNLPKEQHPKIVYTWFFFKQHSGLIYVTANYSQPIENVWKERHFLELHIADGSFGEYFDLQKPAEKKKFTGDKSTLSAKGAAFSDGKNHIAMFGNPSVTVYDGLKVGFGPYLLANGQGAWSQWNEKTGTESSWLHISADSAALPDTASYQRSASVKITLPELDNDIKTWLDTARNTLFYSGSIKTKEELKSFKIDNERFGVIQSKRTGLLLEQIQSEKSKGIQLAALVDVPSKTLLTPLKAQSIFTVKLREKQDGEPNWKLHTLTSDSNWKSADWKLDKLTGTLTCVFTGLNGVPNGDRVQLQLSISPKTAAGDVWYIGSGITVKWTGFMLPMNLSLQDAALFPLRLSAFGNNMKGFYPQASGIAVDSPFTKSISWSGTYPGGWCTMPWFAVWNDAADKNVGLYIAAHDVNGTTKKQSFRSNVNDETVQIALEYPAEDLGQKNSCFAPCTIVIETFNGDWYDAAVMYREWVRNEAVWYPRSKITAEGRIDTPLWARELAVWNQHGQRNPANMLEELRAFQSPLNIPVAVHWYNWHKVPFDNDYPHYFPTQDGFKKAVADIQKDGDLFVMPYINGRLWDTRDKEMEDYLFTKEAFPGVTKKEDGTPYTETYGSKEKDGSPVVLGVMCPASDVWKNKQSELIKRLTGAPDGKDDNEGNMGVKAVYVDQVAAAKPELCFDKTHGHPLGGGDWWVPAYRDMFEKIRAELPKDAMLTTECNAEPFIDIFDGYLTWHFQHDNEVPAFAAVYGGAVQMFGRAYGGGADHVIAAKMKLAESFVFGEQIGWISPHVVKDAEKYNYLKKVVALRYKFRKYFYAGEMCRPPKLIGAMPRVTADWHFSGRPTIVTANVIQTGAWRIPAQNSVILMFANFSKDTVENQMRFDVKEIGLEPNKIAIVRHNPDGTESVLPELPTTLKFGDEEVFVLEIKAK